MGAAPAGEAEMDVVEAMHSWRSIRAYRPEPRDRAVIEDLLWHAVQVSTPLFSGDAPWAFAVLEGVERIEAFGERAKAYARDHRPPGRRGLGLDRAARLPRALGAPAVVLICARGGNSQTPFDCCRAGQYLMLAAHAGGLGSCWVGAPLPWLQTPGVAEELALPDGYVPVVAMLLGHPVDRPEPKSRPLTGRHLVRRSMTRGRGVHPVIPSQKPFTREKRVARRRSVGAA